MSRRWNTIIEST